jgi:hypothetical protein
MGGGRRGLLYARNYNRALLIPVPLTVGNDELNSTDDLHTFQWLNEFGEGTAIIHPNTRRTVISEHPTSRTLLPWTLVICVEDHAQSRPNYLLHSLGCSYAGFKNIYMPSGNVLVLKRDHEVCSDILDVNPDDVQTITDIIIRYYFSCH